MFNWLKEMPKIHVTDKLGITDWVEPLCGRMYNGEKIVIYEDKERVTCKRCVKLLIKDQRMGVR